MNPRLERAGRGLVPDLAVLRLLVQVDDLRMGDPEVMRRNTGTPAQVYLRWCPKCDRTDRVSNLSDRHHIGGKRCDGIPVQLVYTRAVQAS